MLFYAHFKLGYVLLGSLLHYLYCSFLVVRCQPSNTRSVHLASQQHELDRNGPHPHRSFTSNVFSKIFGRSGQWRIEQPVQFR
ncbi:hypothetical protein BCR34DRAFT_560646 [Clohesyomyces aquaticus]|uniref:Uncharacterized protein n=1 Tax=Clohesyomyces aquaticus TaxID=1231657 RepID=A0A1Y1ZVN3_9PLEO|nr:hypothetical protein BCR34DRAFT_560646 [Clohesyomyces aquaticus]